MINVLGMKRIAILAVLIAINGLLGVLTYMYIMPETLAAQRNLSGLRGSVTTIQSDIDNINLEFDQLEKQQSQYEELERNGFFGDQDRFAAERIFEQVQAESGVLSAVASISGGEIIEDEDAAKSDRDVLRSSIEIKIEAANDLHVFKYIANLMQAFPGYISLQSIELRRTAEITGTVLRSFASGEDPVLVEADIVLSWSTMIPKTDVGMEEQR